MQELLQWMILQLTQVALTNKTLTHLNAFSGTGDGSITGNPDSKIDAGILEGKGGVTYEFGTDTATDVAIVSVGIELY